MATTRLTIGPADHGRRMTLEEFEEAEEQPGYLYELARGVLEVTEVPNDPHAQIIDNLHEAVTTYRRAHPGLILRLVHGSEVRLVLPEWNTGRHPDFGVIFRRALPNARGRRMPELVAEVVSPGASARDRDYVAKREEYLEFGIREYWIIDPAERRVTVLLRREEPGPARWEERSFRGPEAIDGELLIGFAGTVSGLWADVEPDDAPPA